MKRDPAGVFSTIWFIFSAAVVGLEDSDQIVDISIQVRSPINGSLYVRGEKIWAIVDIDAAGNGPVATAIRADPSNFEMCIRWDDQSVDPYCKSILSHGAELPNFNAEDGVTGPHVFHAWVQRKGIPTALASAPPVIYSTRRDRYPCIAAFVLTGTLRTFASALVRRRLVASMAALGRPYRSKGRTEGGCSIEVLAHVPKPETVSVPWASRSWVATSHTRIGTDKAHDSEKGLSNDDKHDYGTLVRPFEASGIQVETALDDLNRTICGMQNLNLVSVRWYDEAAHHQVPNGCATGLPPPFSYPQLYKMAAAFHTMVLPRERHILKRQYTWVVRCRWDIAFLRPPPPLEVLRRDAISLSYSFWPISDQFAIVPRRYAGDYFSAVDTFYNCAEEETIRQQRHLYLNMGEEKEEEKDEDEGDNIENQKYWAHWFLPGQISTEIVLARHLMYRRRTPFSFIELNAPIVRATNPEVWCRVKQTLQLPCLILRALGWVKWIHTGHQATDEAKSAGGERGDGDEVDASVCHRVGMPPANLLEDQCVDDFRLVTTQLGIHNANGKRRGLDQNDDELHNEKDSTRAASSVPDWEWHRTSEGEAPRDDDHILQPMEVYLKRGSGEKGFDGPTANSSHAIRIALCPSRGALRELLAAVDAAASNWAAAIPRSLYRSKGNATGVCTGAVCGGNEAWNIEWGAFRDILDAEIDVDAQLAVALQHVLKEATYELIFSEQHGGNS